MNARTVMHWFLKFVSWTMLAFWLIALVVIGNWLAFHHHNDEVGRKIAPLFIISMIATRGIIWLVGKAADRF